MSRGASRGGSGRGASRGGRGRSTSRGRGRGGGNSSRGRGGGRGNSNSSRGGGGRGGASSSSPRGGFGGHAKNEDFKRSRHSTRDEEVPGILAAPPPPPQSVENSSAPRDSYAALVRSLSRRRLAGSIDNDDDNNNHTDEGDEGDGDEERNAEMENDVVIEKLLSSGKNNDDTTDEEDTDNSDDNGDGDVDVHGDDEVSDNDDDVESSDEDNDNESDDSKTSDSSINDDDEVDEEEEKEKSQDDASDSHSQDIESQDVDDAAKTTTTDIYASRFHTESLEDEATGVSLRLSELNFTLIPSFHLASTAAGCEKATSITGQLTLSASTSARSAATLSASLLGGRSAPPPPLFDLLSTRQNILPRLALAWRATYGAEARAAALRRAARSGIAIGPGDRPFTPLQVSLWPAIADYRDALTAIASRENARELRTLTALHAANHALRSREIVAANDGALAAAVAATRAARVEAAAAEESGKEITTKGKGAIGRKGRAALAAAQAPPPPLPDTPRDQGFTRPTVLILAPTRHAALLWVRSLLRLLTYAPSSRERRRAAAAAAAAGEPAPPPPAERVAILNRNRFFREFSADEDLHDDAEEERNMPRALASIALRERQMMSEGEGEETEEEQAESTAAGGCGRYTYGAPRQGWPKGLRERLRQERAVEREEEARGGGVAAAEAEAEAIAKAAALALTARGKKRKADDSILGSSVEIARVDAKERRKAEKEAERAAAGRESTSTPATDATRSAHAAARRQPADFRATFSGLSDDDFRVGISLSKKTVRLYADFYESDILVASPLGLRRITGGEGDRAKDRDTDFLSSIEIAIILDAHVLAAQNWSHVEDVLGLTNALPKAAARTDFSRVREWALGGLGRFFRQTIITSAWLDVDTSRLFRRASHNTRGGVLLRGTYSGTIGAVAVPVRQTFIRVQSPLANASEADDARFEHFETRILPVLIAGTEGGGGSAAGATTAARTLIFVPSYFDYVRLRNLLDAREVEFVTCSEYSEDKDVSRAR